MKLKTRLLLTLFGSLSYTIGYSQTNEKIPKPAFLSFQTGAFVDGYNSFGFRAFFEYQKDLKKNWEYGISFEQSVHLFRAATDHYNSLSSNISFLCYNHYYKLKLFKDRVFWTTGLGAGVANVNWDGNNKIGIVFNGSVTLNVRITKRLYIETSPLLVLLPFNRVYYSPINVSTYTDLYGGPFFPIGFKVKL